MGSNGIDLKTTKIKELPVKDTIDKDSVLLIEDNQDTKQMKVELFYKAIENLIDSVNSQVQVILTEARQFIDDMEVRDAAIAKNEEIRQTNETARKLDEDARRSQFQIWTDKFDKMEEFYNNAVKNEATRISNEEYRVTEWDKWSEFIALWTANESQRQTNEMNRNTVFDNKVSEVNNVVSIANNTILTMNNSIVNCNNATDRCIEVTDTLNEMIDIGTKVPSSLPSGQIYLQYFDK